MQSRFDSPSHPQHPTKHLRNIPPGLRSSPRPSLVPTDNLNTTSSTTTTAPIGSTNGSAQSSTKALTIGTAPNTGQLTHRSLNYIQMDAEDQGQRTNGGDQFIRSNSVTNNGSMSSLQQTRQLNQQQQRYSIPPDIIFDHDSGHQSPKSPANNNRGPITRQQQPQYQTPQPTPRPPLAQHQSHPQRSYNTNTPRSNDDDHPSRDFQPTFDNRNNNNNNNTGNQRNVPAFDEFEGFNQYNNKNSLQQYYQQQNVNTKGSMFVSNPLPPSSPAQNGVGQSNNGANLRGRYPDHAHQNNNNNPQNQSTHSPQQHRPPPQHHSPNSHYNHPNQGGGHPNGFFNPNTFDAAMFTPEWSDTQSNHQPPPKNNKNSRKNDKPRQPPRPNNNPFHETLISTRNSYDLPKYNPHPSTRPTPSKVADTQQNKPDNRNISNNNNNSSTNPKHTDNHSRSHPTEDPYSNPRHRRATSLSPDGHNSYNAHSIMSPPPSEGISTGEFAMVNSTTGSEQQSELSYNTRGHHSKPYGFGGDFSDSGSDASIPFVRKTNNPKNSSNQNNNNNKKKKNSHNTTFKFNNQEYDFYPRDGYIGSARSATSSQFDQDGDSSDRNSVNSSRDHNDEDRRVSKDSHSTSGYPTGGQLYSPGNNNQLGPRRNSRDSVLSGDIAFNSDRYTTGNADFAARRDYNNNVPMYNNIENTKNRTQIFNPQFYYDDNGSQGSAANLNQPSAAQQRQMSYFQRQAQENSYGYQPSIHSSQQSQSDYNSQSGLDSDATSHSSFDSRYQPSHYDSSDGYYHRGEYIRYEDLVHRKQQLYPHLQQQQQQQQPPYEENPRYQVVPPRNSSNNAGTGSSNSSPSEPKTPGIIQSPADGLVPSLSSGNSSGLRGTLSSSHQSQHTSQTNQSFTLSGTSAQGSHPNGSYNNNNNASGRNPPNDCGKQSGTTTLANSSSSISFHGQQQQQQLQYQQGRQQGQSNPNEYSQSSFTTPNQPRRPATPNNFNPHHDPYHRNHPHRDREQEYHQQQHFLSNNPSNDHDITASSFHSPHLPVRRNSKPPQQHSSSRQPSPNRRYHHGYHEHDDKQAADAGDLCESMSTSSGMVSLNRSSTQRRGSVQQTPSQDSSQRPESVHQTPSHGASQKSNLSGQKKNNTTDNNGTNNNSTTVPNLITGVSDIPTVSDENGPTNSDDSALLLKSQPTLLVVTTTASPIQSTTDLPPAISPAQPPQQTPINIANTGPIESNTNTTTPNTNDDHNDGNDNNTNNKTASIDIKPPQELVQELSQMPHPALCEYTAKLIVIGYERESSTAVLMQQLQQVNTLVDKLSNRAATVTTERNQLSKANATLTAKVSSLEAQNSVLIEELTRIKGELDKSKNGGQ